VVVFANVFAKCKGVCLAGLLLLLIVERTSAASRPPNVLILCADDHAPYVCGAYGNRIVRTPVLDRLARTGLRFDRAFCNSPVCTASRQSFLTGRYPRTIGVTQLTTPLTDDETTLAELMAEAGYDTAALGKMHFNSDRKHGFGLRLDLPDYRRWRQSQPTEALPDGMKFLPAWRPFRDPAREWLNAECRPYAAGDADMASTWLARQAAAWLKQPRTRPFFLMVSFYEPHSPFHFPMEYAGRHRPEEFDVPPVSQADAETAPAVFSDLTAAEKQGIMAAYYTSVEFLDANVGRVLAALDQSGHAHDTLIVYLSDHGYLLGQHGRFEKHCSYDEAIRVPLLISYAPLVSPGTNTGTLIELIDLAPTILEICQLPVPAAVQGRSFTKVLSAPGVEHRDAVIVEYAPNEEIAIRTAGWKLVYLAGKHQRRDGYAPLRPPAGREIRLFDLENDPQELVNVADRPENRPLREQLLNRLARHLRETARRKEQIPQGDLFQLLDYCVQPRDAGPQTGDPGRS
jgi:choline-sulfatase